jgi:ATP-dependent Clp protease ATP-binding subunit ClpC
MFEKLSKEAIQVLLLAQQEAQRLGDSHCGSEHILLGLIGQNQGTATQLIKSKGLTLQEARSTVEMMKGRGLDLAIPTNHSRSIKELPFTQNCQKLFELSWDEARKQLSNNVQTDHLFLAIFSLNKGFAIEMLNKHGFNLNELRQLVLANQVA